MHTNYYFLRKLSEELNTEISGATITECFTQSKDELYLAFSKPSSKTFWMQIRVSPDFAGLAFPSDVKRARRNSADLFPSLLNSLVERVVQTPYDRSFTLYFTNSSALLCKFHGNRSNIILLGDNKVKALFKSKLASDWQTTPEALANDVQINAETFAKCEGNLAKLWPVAGKEIKGLLSESNYSELTGSEKINHLKKLESDLLSANAFYIEDWDGKPTLMLVPSSKPELSYNRSATTAAHELYRRYTQDYFLAKRKLALLQQVQKRIKSSENYIAKTKKTLAILKGKRDLKQQADVIMANLHAIPYGSTEVVLFNFYTNSNQNYKLRHELNPQKNAERLYKKAKSQHKEEDYLNKNIDEKESRLFTLLTWQEALEKTQDFSEIKHLEKDINPIFKEEDNRKPFWEELYSGWQIWVGRGAADNDSLLRYHSHKEDWWLHAKDVAGSHVLVKHKAGQVTPAAVLERAACLAAWHSKRRHDTLCPVICTPRKWIRKRKGSAPGMVAVDREEQVLLVPPAS